MKTFSKFITSTIFEIFIFFIFSSHLFAAISDIERQSLVNLYNSTGGQNWKNNEGWLDDKGTECGWYGITCNNNKDQIFKIALNNNNLTGDGEISFLNFSGLENIDLSGNKFTNLTIPNVNLPSLIKLNLSNNQLTTFPESFNKCNQLKKIDLSTNNLSNISIGSNYCQIIDLSNNKISSLSIESTLVNLINLNLENNLLSQLPADICKQYLLQILNLSNNTLTEFPDDIINIKTLRTIDISENSLTEIPYHLGSINSLTTINLSNNTITGMNSEILKYKFVQKLDLSHNTINSIPENISLLKKLKELNLSNCKISEKLPEEIGSLINLKSLDLSQNELMDDDIPFTMGNLINLNTLSLQSNFLTYFPKWITNLKYLTFLDLSSNQMKGKIPVEIVQLEELKYINLSEQDVEDHYHHYYTTGGLTDRVIDIFWLYTANEEVTEFLSNISTTQIWQRFGIGPHSSYQFLMSSAEKKSYSENAIIPIYIEASYFSIHTGYYRSFYTKPAYTSTITLETGLIDRTITSLPLSNTETQAFNYIVQPGDFSDDLSVKSMNIRGYKSDGYWYPVNICSVCSLDDTANIYVDATYPETTIIYPPEKGCIQNIDNIRGETYDISGNFSVEVQLTDGVSYYNTENKSWQKEEYWYVPLESLFIGKTKEWSLDTKGIEWNIEKSYTITVKSRDFAGNKSYKSTIFNYGMIDSQITCNLSKNTIILGESLSITGTIQPSENVINSGVSIEFISPFNQTIYRSTQAQIDGSFKYDITCDDISTSGKWFVRTTWEGHSCLMPSMSNSIQLTVTKAKSEIALDVMHDALKYGDPLSVSGVFTPIPNCGGDLSGIQILLNFTNGMNRLSKTIYTSDFSGHFQLVNYTGLDAFGDWQVKAMVFDNTGAYKAASSGTMIVRVVESAGYAIIVQGKISKEEGIKSHKKTSHSVYNHLKLRGLKDDNDFDDIRFFYNFNPDDDPSEMAHIYEKPDKNIIQKAFIDWASTKMNNRPANLYVVLVDHGHPDTFYIDPDTISSTEIGQWLDMLQDQLYRDAMEQEIIVILGFCHSGSFIDELSGPNRVIIASAAENEFSYKGPLDKDEIREGEFFVSEFFKYVSQGKSVNESFSNAVLLTERFTESIIDGSINAPPFFDKSTQHPLLDDNGDGIGTNDLTIEGDEGKLSRNLIIGISTLTGNNPGDVGILKVADSLCINEKNIFPSEVPWAVLDSKDFVSLWIEIKTPDYIDIDDTKTEQKELNLPKLIYSPSQNIDASNSINIEQSKCINTSTETYPYTWTWKYIKEEANINFSTPGTYQIFYFAKDKDSGNVSPFKETKVYKNKENNASPLKFELLTPVNGSILSIQGVLFECNNKSNPNCYTHLSWEETTDPENNIITYSLIFSKNNAAFDSPCDIIRYDQINENAWPINLPDNWDGNIIYWKVMAIDQYGARKESSVNNFTINNYGNPMTSTIKGRVTNAINEINLKDVMIKIGEKRVTTNRRGYYFCKLAPDNYSISLSKKGYLPVYADKIILNQNALTTKDFVMIPDLNIDNKPPVISNIADQITTEDHPIEIVFSVHDETVLLSSLILTSTSSNTTIIPHSHIRISDNYPGYCLTIKPEKDQYGETQITVNANDGALSSSKTFKLSIEPVDDKPEISIIYDQQIFEDQPIDNISFSIVDVDTDINNYDISIRSSVQSIINDSDIHLNGSDELRSISLTPVKDAFGKSVITITAKKDDQEVSQSFTIQVEPVNDPPAIENVTIEVIENILEEFSLSAYDAENDPLSYILRTRPINGNINWKPPKVFYISKENACNNDYFEFIVSDGQLESAIARVDIIIHPKTCKPVVENISVETNENEFIDFMLKGKDTSENNLNLIYEITDYPSFGHSSVYISSLLYTPKLNWSGIDRMKYIARCTGCNTNISQQAEILIKVNNTNDIPTTISPIPDYETDEDKPIPSIIFSVNDPDTSIEEIETLTLSSNTSLIPNQNINIKSFTSIQVMAITPAENQWGESNIDLICKSNGKSVTQSFIVKVNSVDDPPFVLNPIKDITVNQNSSYTQIDLSNVFDDIDNESQSIVKSVKTNTLNDLVALEINNNLLTIFFNKDHFGIANIVIIGTSNNKTAKTSFNITVKKLSQAPIVSDVFIPANEDITSYISLAEIKNSFNDPDHDLLSKIRITSLPDHGILLLNNIPVSVNDEISVSEIASKSLAFKPDLDWNGNTSFLWQAFDSHLWSKNSAHIIFTYFADPVNISTIMKKGIENKLLVFYPQDLAGFSLNYSNSQIQAVSLPENGTLLFDKDISTEEYDKEITTNENLFNGTPIPEGLTMNIQDLLSGVLAFMPDHHFNGFTQFLWRASKDGVWSDNEYVKIEITPINDPPVILNGSISGKEDMNLFISYTFFTSLFHDVDQDELKKIRFNKLPSNGKLKINDSLAVINTDYNSNNLHDLIYIPNENYFGIDSFEWNGFDGIVYADSSALITITILPIDDAPYVKNKIENIIINEDSKTYSIDLKNIFDDIDNDNNGIAKTIISNTNSKLLSADISNNTLLVDLHNDQYGEASIVIRGSSNGLHEDYQLNITVMPVDDIPVVLNPISNIITDEDSIINKIDLSEVFFDVDNIEPVSTSIEISNKNLIEANISENELSLMCIPDQSGESFLTVYGTSNGQTISNTFKLIINPINDPPDIDDIDSQVMNEDSKLEGISLIINDVDTSLENLKITLNSDNTKLVPNDHIIINSHHQEFSIDITPYTNMYGITNISVFVEDELTRIYKSFKVNVLPVNDAPFAQPLKIFTNEGEETITVLKGFDVDEDELSYKIVKKPEKGDLYGDMPYLIYKPFEGICGKDQFTYQISDGKQMSLPESVNFTITALSCEPNALEVNISMQMNSSENIILKGYEKNQHALSYTIIENPSHGRLTGSPPNIIYTPDSGWFGFDEFSFSSSCGKCNPQLSEPACVKIEVLNINEWAPEISLISNIAKPEDTMIDFSFVVMDKDTAFNEISINYQIFSSELFSENDINMTCIEPNCFVSIVPKPNAFGIVTMHVSAFDGISTTNESIEISIIAIDDPPTMLNIHDQQTNEDMSIVNIPLTISDIDTNIEELLITFTSSNTDLVPTDNIVLYKNSNNFSFTLTPVDNAYGTCIIAVKLNDKSKSVIQTFKLNVLPVNDQPFAETIYLETIEESNKIFVLKGFDVDGDILNYSILEYPQKGQLSGNTPNIIFTPHSGICGNDSFSYQVSDGIETAIAPVYITITALTCEPHVSDQTVSTGLNRACNITLNGYELSQKSFQYEILSHPLHGQLTGNPPYLTYQPESDHYGKDYFTYAAICGKCEPVMSEPATVTIIISNETNAPPVIYCKSNMSTNEDTPLEIIFLITDSDNDFENISVSVDFNPLNIIDQHSLVCLESGCFLSITPSSNAFGKTIINISANDSISYVNKQIAFDVLPVNDPPVIGLIPDLVTNEDMKIDYHPLKISDSDTAYDQLDITITSSNSSLILESNVIINDQVLTIIPTKNQWGKAEINIFVSDRFEEIKERFSVTVESVNDPPIAVDANVKLFKTNTKVIILKANDIDNEQLVFTIEKPPLYGRLIGAPPYVLYLLEKNDIQYDNFSFKASDGFIRSNEANIYITFYEDIMTGDFDVNNRVDLQDVILIYQIIAGFQSTDISLDADVNNDNQVNIADAIYIMNHFLNEKIAPSLSNGLIAHYTFDGNANDNSGHDKHGKLYGPVFVADRFGNMNSACSFDGVDDYIVLTDTKDDHFLSSGFTLSLWVKFEPYLQFGQQIIGKNNCAELDQGFSLGSFSSSLIYSVNGFPFIIPQKNGKELTIETLVESGWHHIICVYDMSELTQYLYIDGELAGSQIKLYQQQSDQDIYIGGVSQGCQNSIYFHGLIDDIRIYNRPLIAEEIQLIVSEELNSTPNKLIDSKVLLY